MSDTLATPMSPETHSTGTPPIRMKWLDTLLNPLGRSNKLEFTRAWTLLFFLQFFAVVLPIGFSIVIGLAGGNGGAVTTFGMYVAPIVFVTTTVMSFIIHARRLKDANKWIILSGIVLIPLLLGMMQFTSGLQQSAADYDRLYEKRADYLADQKAWTREHQAEQRIKQAARSRVQANRKIVTDIESDVKDFFDTLLFGEYERKALNPERWQTRSIAQFETLKQRIKDNRTPGEVTKNLVNDMMWPDSGEQDPATWRAERIAVFENLRDAVDTAYMTEAQAESFVLSLLTGVDQTTLAQDPPADPEEGEEASEPSARYKVMQRIAFEPVPFTEEGVIALQSRSEAALEGIGYYRSQRFVNRAMNNQSPQYRADSKLPSQIGFVLEPNLGAIQNTIIPISFLIMIWSLLWVARKPTFNRDDETMVS